MDLYTKDSNFFNGTVIDNFESLVWTERYNDSGDVTLVVPATPEMRALIVEDTFLYTSSSQEIMIIDSVDTKDNVITATGRSLVDFLKQRIFRRSWQTTLDAWVTTGSDSAGAIINIFLGLFVNPGTYLTNGTVLTSTQGANEVMPKVSFSPAPSGSGVAVAVPYGDLFTALKTVADADNLGFTMYPLSVTDNTGNIYFKTYRGLDRTSSQSTNPIVIFDSALDSLVDIDELRSKSGYKNVCWVWPSGATAQSQVVAVYAPGAAALTNFQRRSMMLVADDINAPDYTAAVLTSVLTQKGKDALANNNYVRMTDGTIVPQNAFTYGVDYNLGDVIELRGTSNVAQKARITEYIRSQDSTGERAYPTLSVL